MSGTATRLYELLPAIHRLRDSAQGEPLKALLAVIAEQVAIVEDDLDQLYDDQFIETCAEWVAPYIGDLIGYRSLYGVTPRIGSPRAEVANTIGFRRRKGTAAMLEQLARDVTGWDARVVEFFEWLGWNQYMNHTRVDPARGGMLDLRNHDACERTSCARGAFDEAAHTIDVRSPSPEYGRYNIPNIGLFLWRLRPYTLIDTDAREVAGGRFAFSPLGLDAPLFNPLTRGPEEAITEIAREIDVAHELRPRVLYDELEARRLTLAMNERSADGYFGDPPAFSVALDGDLLAPDEITICRLDGWQLPSNTRRYALPDGSTVTRKIRAAVDPVLGRLTVPSSESAREVTVTCAYGFSDDMGGGPYDRTESVRPELRDLNFQAVVTQELAPVAGHIFATLTEAVAAWNVHCAASPAPPAAGAIAILDNRTYAESLTGTARITMPEQARLIVVGAEWPEVPSPSGPARRVVDQLSPIRMRPHIAGDLSVVGTADGGADVPGRLVLNGLLIEGSVRVLIGNLGSLDLTHCTIVPGAGELEVNASATDAERNNERLVVTVDHSICGLVRLPDTVRTLRVTSSIVSNGPEPDDAGMTVDAISADTAIEQSTVFGRAAVRSISASNSIFTGTLAAARRQFGCLRFSYAPLDSTGPRRFRCQPDLEIATQVERAERGAGGPISAADRDAIVSGAIVSIRPSFTSVRYGLPAFSQLREGSAIQLRTGADDEAEMGAFHDLHQPQREANLRVRLEEYLRAGLQACIVYVS